MRNMPASGRLGTVLLVLSATVGAMFSADAEMGRVAELIRKLGDDDFARREEANKELCSLGESALPQLQEAAIKNPDLEVRQRARKAMIAILEVIGISKSSGLKMSPVEGGEFAMGSPRNERGRRLDENRHDVRITQLFLLGTHEVTQEEYQGVMKTNPSAFQAKGPGNAKVAKMDTSKFPVENVSWFDAIDFCNRLSKQDGYEPYYKLTDEKRDGNSIKEATVTIRGGNGYRLPTEAEWERACRAITATRFHFGDFTQEGQLNSKPLAAGGYGDGLRWPDLQRSTKVGSYPANAFGLHDMHGNVAEWCWDWYDREYYERSPRDDPHGPNQGRHKVVRGGSWILSEDSCRSASRYFLAPEERKDTVGFRVARTPGPALK